MVTTYSTDKTTAALGITAVSNTFILELMQNAPDSYIRVYLFALMQHQNPAFANDDVALALKMTETDVTAAFEYWQRKGLVRVLRAEPLHIEFCSPSTVSVSSKGRYNKLIEALRPILGTRILSATELKTVYDWIEVFGLSEEAVEALFIYCIGTKGARTSIRYMDEVAKAWADKSIFTAEDAKDYIAGNTAANSGARDILKRFGLKRNPTDDEVALYIKWTCDYKLSHDVIMDACVGMTSASNPSFAYLSGIIEDYREHGATDIESLAQYHKGRAILEDFCKELLKTAGIHSKPTANHRLKIEAWLTNYHMPKDTLLLLAKYAAAKSRPFDFMSKKVNAWNEADIRNYSDAKADLENTAQQTTKTVLQASGYKQRSYTSEDLKKLGVDFGDNDD